MGAGAELLPIIPSIGGQPLTSPSSALGLQALTLPSPMAVVSPPVTAASGPPSCGSGPSSSTSSPRSQIQTADTATTITQGATSGHSSPHFRFGRNGGWDPGCSLDVGECVLLTRCEFKREVSCWRWGPDQHSWRSAVGQGCEVASTELGLVLDDFDQIGQGT